MAPYLADRTRPRSPGRWGWRIRAWQIERVWRDLVPVIALALAFYAVLGVQGKVDRQREGRAIALDIICGFSNGVAAAGRETILSSTVQPREFRKNLERLGLPPERVRRVHSWQAARSYALSISESVAQQAGFKDGLVRRDGSMDCAKLRRLSRATTPTP